MDSLLGVGCYLRRGLPELCEEGKSREKGVFTGNGRCLIYCPDLISFIFHSFDPAWSGNLNGQPQYSTASPVAMKAANVKIRSSQSHQEDAKAIRWITRAPSLQNSLQITH
jgi:hypothetical protein